MFLFVDVLAYDSLFQPDGRDSIASGPEVFASEVSGLVAKLSGDSYGALALQEAYHSADLDFWRNLDEHVDVIMHEMTFDDFAILLVSERVKDFTETGSYLAIESFLSHFGNEDEMVFTIPLGVG